jgi:sugar/nucleoside kinase (ribokinase family)
VKTIDLLGFGIAAVDDLIEVSAFPVPGEKRPLVSHARQGGGLSLTALVTASRMGLKCHYAGVLGNNELSDFVRGVLEHEGIAHSEKHSHPEAEPYHSFIFIDPSAGTRTILFHEGGVVEPRPADIPDDLITASRVLTIDHGGAEGMIHACQIARREGVPTIGDLERNRGNDLPALLPWIDHLILPWEAAEELTGQANPTEAVAALARQPRVLTAVTRGDQGCWYVEGEPGKEVHHQPAFKVHTVDTNGCGDVFHGAYAAAMVWEYPAPAALRFASAAAAIKASRPAGQAGIPNRAEVEAFLEAAV